jgi:broad specificity phosphatase PhoE
MTIIYLVRHGITQANKENRFAGRTDEELLAEGKEQILQVGEQLKKSGITSVYCGPAKRTVQSAELLGALLNVPFSSLQELDEINIPHWDGLTKDEIRQRYKAEYPTWLNSPETFCLPGCESLKQVQKRAVTAVNHLLAQKNSGNLLLVSHLIVLRCLVLFFRELGIEKFRSIMIDNGSINYLSEDVMGRKWIHTM